MLAAMSSSSWRYALSCARSSVRSAIDVMRSMSAWVAMPSPSRFRTCGWDSESYAAAAGAQGSVPAADTGSRGRVHDLVAHLRQPVAQLVRPGEVARGPRLVTLG